MHECTLQYPETYPELVAEVAMGDDGVVVDLDTPDAMHAAEQLP